ncbi:Polyketide cyclase / dehydrase and lipid transport [Enhygromyxa salina]|uniref:Polyketide cyclase / dehydrase and lipid transport n=1 Tax=Enhygromyxa salina TaxID=215803 RepID=A0A2S9XGY9_9BACT|nr:SRPBCC family protein [Enhygromyxa salina]PRP92133.1 Polyketide cyclase / dehydrase and lipid transport [Enhygromyxa salina]
MTEAATNESLAGSEAPSAKLMLKWVGIVLLLAAVTVVVVGVFLPREWHVEQSVDIEADVAQIHAQIADLERWDAWMFDPELEGADMLVEVEGSGVGATISWSGKGSTGAMTLVEADPATGIRWDGRVETDEINNHGSISYEPLDGGLVRVTLVDEGTLPPVLGGYFAPVMNSALSQHFEAALGRLELVAEAEAEAERASAD